MSKIKKQHPKNYIKELREDRGLSLRELAEKINVFHQTLSNIELSKATLTWPTMQKIADALQCHPMEITEGPLTTKEPIEREMVQKFRVLKETEKRMFVHMLDSMNTNKNNDNHDPTHRKKP